MGKKPIRLRIYEDIFNIFGNVAGKLYFGRPKNIPNGTDSFLVFSMPNITYDITTGVDDFVLKTTGVLSLYVKSKSDSTLNVEKQTTLEQAVIDKFPASGEAAHITTPTCHEIGYDGYGFNETVITFKIRTKQNINNK